eukprot:9073689-Pyramimonas_sp.AAC.1
MGSGSRRWHGRCNPCGVGRQRGDLLGADVAEGVVQVQRRSVGGVVALHVGFLGPHSCSIAGVEGGPHPCRD